MKEYSELRFWYYAIQDGIPGTMYNKTIRYLLRYKKGKWVSRVSIYKKQRKPVSGELTGFRSLIQLFKGMRVKCRNQMSWLRILYEGGDSCLINYLALSIERKCVQSMFEM